VIVAVYVPGAAFAGRSTEMVGFQEALLRPVLTPFTTGETPVRSVVTGLVAVTPVCVIVPTA
jgi:hypothetical protein